MSSEWWNKMDTEQFHKGFVQGLFVGIAGVLIGLLIATIILVNL